MDLKQWIDENDKRIDNIEKKHMDRHEQDVEDRENDEKRRQKSKQDIFKWLHLPLSNQDNGLLKRMIRVRLLEILSDVR